MSTLIQLSEGEQVKAEQQLRRIQNSNEIESTISTKSHFYFFITWFFLVTIPFSLWQMVGHLFSQDPRHFKRRGTIWANVILRMTGYKVEVLGAKNLNKGPYVFVSNHQNGLDIPVQLANLPVPFGFVAKADLRKMPFLGWALRSSGNIFVDRSTARKAVESLNEAAKQIKMGQSVLIYPEGMRTWSGEMTDFMKGAFQLACKSEVPIIPVALINNYEFMDERRQVSRGGKIRMVLGDPIELDDETKRNALALSKKVKDAIAELVREGRQK